MAKKKKLKLVVISLSVALTSIFLVVYAIYFMKYRNIKTYVIQNKDMLTEFAQSLYQSQDDSFEVYHKKGDIPDMINSDTLYLNYSIDSVAVWKNHQDVEDRVKIWFRIKPMNNVYYHCGIYYSLNDVIVDYYGKAQSGDAFEYDGVPEKVRIRYKTEKICDNWYYFEEAVWN